MSKAVVLTWGCTHNQKDSELIEGELIRGGYELLHQERMDEADIVILNTCTVKTPTENKIIYTLDNLQRTDKKVVIAGCLSQADPEYLAARYPTFPLLGVNAAPKILGVLNDVNQSSTLIPLLDTLSGPKGIRDNKKDWSDKPLLASHQGNGFRHIVQINEGCVNFCSFCATKKARGHLRSYKLESIVESLRRHPTPEVWLTSQDTACWGFDNGQNLTDLIDEIDKIDRKIWVRVGMGNPNNFIKFLNDVVEAFKSEKIYKFLHLPVQAGNNEVLKHMKRGYTVEEYETIVEVFRREIPKLTLSTDVICGYPTETETDFEDTLLTIKNTRPSITNISRFWERRGTDAFSLPQLSNQIRKSRSNMLSKLCKEIQYEDNQSWIGWEGEAYLSEPGPKGGLQARNVYYKPIVLDLQASELGSWRNVRITKSTPTYFFGEVVE